jgi:hypothetical protein
MIVVDRHRQRPLSNYFCLLIAVTFFTTGCGNSKPGSVGPAQELVVLADPAEWALLEPHVRDIFEKVLRTPQVEKIYSVRHGRVEDIKSSKYLRRKNLMVLSTIDAQTSTGEFLRTLLSPEVVSSVRSGESGISWKEDVWAEGQLLVVASADNLDSLINSLRGETDRLYAQIERARNRQIMKLVYKYGEREDVTQELADEFGWQVRVPFGYRILDAKPDSGFVLLVKEQPSRWFFVYWEDDIPVDRLTEDWVISKRDEITRRFFENDRIAPGEVEVFESDFSGKLAFVLQGLWENQEKWTGGPFKSYAFLDLERDRFFFIDLGVYSPNKQKETYLRQLDLMANTFRISGEPIVN